MIQDKLLKFAVIIAQTNGEWVFRKHKERDTYEVSGGHREREKAEEKYGAKEVDKIG